MKPKKEKSKKKSKSSKHRKDKSLYEVAEGVTTPSKEHLSGTATPTNVMVSQLICLSLMVFVHCQGVRFEVEEVKIAQSANLSVDHYFHVK